ncbi:hypothetical protein GmHk_15G045175 [Glycine max]|nr:hypothetical protein GmHk_15G045175 [Glycine max]
MPLRAQIMTKYFAVKAILELVIQGHVCDNFFVCEDWLHLNLANGKVTHGLRVLSTKFLGWLRIRWLLLKSACWILNPRLGVLEYKDDYGVYICGFAIKLGACSIDSFRGVVGYFSWSKVGLGKGLQEDLCFCSNSRCVGGEEVGVENLLLSLMALCDP